MGKIKEFVGKHRDAILIGLGVLGGIGSAILASAIVDFLGKKKYVDLTGESIIAYTEDDGMPPFSFEEAQGFMDANRTSGSKYAIFHEEPEADTFRVIVFDQNFKMPGE